MFINLNKENGVQEVFKDKDVKTENYHLMFGDCLERMKEIPDASVDVCKTKYADNLLGDYTTTWFVGYKRVAFFTAHWDELENQWQGCWKVFNKGI